MATDPVSAFTSEIEDLKKKLAAAEGKALAAARAQAAAEREAQRAGQAAQVYRDETDQLIANAADQLRQGWSIGVGIWSLGQWAYATAKRKDYAARLLHREDAVMKILADFVSGHRNGNKATLETALRDAERAVTIFKANTEKLNLDRWEMLILHVGKVNAEKMEKAKAILLETE